MSNKSSIHPSFGVLVSVFFFWGFVAASNGIFIPFCKQHFNLSQFESQLIDAAFYSAYFYGSLLLYMSSYLLKTDLLNSIGYKKGILTGLFISAIGASGLAIASSLDGVSFSIVLLCFFIIALGFSLQQTAAQPYVVAMGTPETGAHRLNLAGGVNSFGTLLGPLVVSFLLFGNIASGSDGASLISIQNLYIFLAVLFVLVMLIFGFSKLPKITNTEEMERSPKALLVLSMIGILFPIILFADFISSLTGINKNHLVILVLLLTLGILFLAMFLSSHNKKGWGAMQYPQLILGMIAIFIYVGVEVTIQSNFGALLKQEEFGAFDESNISLFISLYWGSLMIGRWTGALSVFKLNALQKRILTVVVPFIAFALIILVNIIKGNSVQTLFIYPVCILFLIMVLLISNDSPAKMMLLVSLAGAAAMSIGLLTTGTIATYAFISAGLFCSVMWPCIFSMAITGLGKYTSQGSAFLIMMILGGALIPPVQGIICDMDIHSLAFNGITYTHLSYFIPLVGFIYLIWHTRQSVRSLKKQGFNVQTLQD